MPCVSTRPSRAKVRTLSSSRPPPVPPKAITASASSRASASCRSANSPRTTPPALPTQAREHRQPRIDQRRRRAAGRARSRCWVRARSTRRSRPPQRPRQSRSRNRSPPRRNTVCDVASPPAGNTPCPGITGATASTRSPRSVMASSGATASVPGGMARRHRPMRQRRQQRRRIGTGIGDRRRLDREAVGSAIDVRRHSAATTSVGERRAEPPPRSRIFAALTAPTRVAIKERQDQRATR